jgi:hypothetical protein
MTTTSKEATENEGAAVVYGLTALDAEIRKVTGGDPGAGIYTLLDQLAGQFLGVPRGSFPPPFVPPEPPPETTREVEASKEREAKEREAREEREKHEREAAKGPHRR